MQKASLLLFIAIVTVAVAQTPKPLMPKTFPGKFPYKIQLLPGFKVETTQGMEGPYGKIWNDAGLTIEFVMVSDAPGDSDPIWRYEQTVNGEKVICSFTKSQELKVDFPRLRTAFWGKVRDQQDVTQMLLMVLTYEVPGVSPKPKPTGKPHTTPTDKE